MSQVLDLKPSFAHPRVAAGGVVLAVVVVAAALYVVEPQSLPLWAQCPFHAITGLHCPGCGTVRGLHQLLHGHLLSALHSNALTMCVLPFLVYPFASTVRLAVTGRALPRVRVRACWTWTLFAMILAYWALRNIPAYPFTLLAPC